MTKAKIEFRHITTLQAEALGEPGHRTFRIVVVGESGSAIIWLEKGQLFQLALAIKELTSTVPATEGESSDEPQEPQPLIGPSIEFEVEKFTLGHTREDSKFMLDSYESNSEDEETPTARVWGSRLQFEAFSDEALRVCAAGRQNCPLCGFPMNKDGHRCARTNGHALEDVNSLQ